MAEMISTLDTTDQKAHHFFLNDLITRCSHRSALRMAVCWPCNEVAFAGAIEAEASGIISPLWVGPERELRRISASLGYRLDREQLIPAETEEQAAAKSAELCRLGHAAALMKGSLHTDLLMHCAVQKEAGLHTSRRFSHVFVLETPNYNRTLFITDAAINIYPTLEDKIDIVKNVIDLAHILGVAMPKVAILSAIETVYPKLTSTLDAAALCKMSDRGQITGAVLDGPLAFDTAINTEAARIKNLKSPVAGESDILVVPDLESGNMLAKQLAYFGKAHLAGIVLGAKVPIVLTSRADSAESRVASCAIASEINARKVASASL